jgi:hypothetical protein
LYSYIIVICLITLSVFFCLVSFATGYSIVRHLFSRPVSGDDACCVAIVCLLKSVLFCMIFLFYIDPMLACCVICINIGIC